MCHTNFIFEFFDNSYIEEKEQEIIFSDYCTIAESIYDGKFSINNKFWIIYYDNIIDHPHITTDYQLHCYKSHILSDKIKRFI